jgi:hypothetical protein
MMEFLVSSFVTATIQRLIFLQCLPNFDDKVANTNEFLDLTKSSLEQNPLDTTRCLVYSRCGARSSSNRDCSGYSANLNLWPFQPFLNSALRIENSTLQTLRRTSCSLDWFRKCYLDLAESTLSSERI